MALSGAVLFKPDISHIDTWPNIFNKDTVVQYKWDLSNLLELVEKTLSNYDDYIQFAIRLQNQYKQYSFDENKIKHYNTFSTGLGSGVEISKYLSRNRGRSAFFVSVACHDVLIR